MAQERETPFTPEEFEVFKSYCYVVFGLHFVGDTMNKNTFIDGDAVVKQVRQALATIEKLQKDIHDLVGELDDSVSFMELFEADELGDANRLKSKQDLLERF
jgi:hypothetical protein